MLPVERLWLLIIINIIVAWESVSCVELRFWDGPEEINGLDVTLQQFSSNWLVTNVEHFYCFSLVVQII